MKARALVTIAMLIAVLAGFFVGLATHPPVTLGDGVIGRIEDGHVVECSCREPRS